MERLEPRFEELAAAIVMQAADDYKRYKFLIDTVDYRKYKDDEGRYIAIKKATREINNVEYFFHSAWFYALSGLNGEKALVGLKKTYKNEYYPIRFEEFMDETRQGRYKFGNDNDK